MNMSVNFATVGFREFIRPNQDVKAVAQAPELPVSADKFESLAEEIFHRSKQRSEFAERAHLNVVKLSAKILDGSATPKQAREDLSRELSSHLLHAHVGKGHVDSAIKMLFGMLEQLSQKHRAELSTQTLSGNVFDETLDRLQDLIGTIKDGYLDIYADMVQKYAAMYSDFNEMIMSKMSEWISTPGDDGYVWLGVGKMHAAMDELIAKYSLPNADAVLFPTGSNGSTGGASKADAEKWLETMGLPADCLQQLSDGSFVVTIDISPLTNIKAGIPAGNADGNQNARMSSAAFQAWQGGFNAQQQKMESALQQYTQKYSNANSIHDNVQKTISSTLSALFDMLKAFTSALG